MYLTDNHHLCQCYNLNISFLLCLLVYPWAEAGFMPCSCLFMLYNKLGTGKNCQIHGSYVAFPVESTGVASFLVTRILKQIVQTIGKFNVPSQIIILRDNAIIRTFTFSLSLLVCP